MLVEGTVSVAPAVISEAHLEPRGISTMELFAPKSSS